MKKYMSLCKVILLCASVVLGVMSVSIKGYAQEVSSQITPRMAYISTSSSTLSITDSGLASVYGTVKGKTGVTYTYVKVTLQKKVSDQWVDVKSWEDSNNSRVTTVSETYQVSSGTYQVIMTCIANTESKTLTSDSVTYQ